MSYTAVSKTISRFVQEGIVGLAPPARGACSGEVQALTSLQEQTIERIICNKRTE